MSEQDPHKIAQNMAQKAAQQAKLKAELAKAEAKRAAIEAKQAAKDAAREAKTLAKSAKAKSRQGASAQTTNAQTASNQAASSQAGSGDIIAPIEAASKNTSKQAKPAKKTNGFWRALKWLFGLGFASGVVACIVVGVLIFIWTRDLPTLEEVQNYRPAQMTRVHAGDGKLIAEYAKEHRVFVPIESIPKDLQHAFVAAEDQRFYRHGGVDWIGFTRAMISNVGNFIRDDRLEGASTITQQVAKNFIVGNERAVRRKVREIFISGRIERALDKDHILELYLNEIFFARRSYGVAAASLNYFGKSMDELSLEEMAYLAILPKGPNNYKPESNYDAAIDRRNYALGRMVEDGYVSDAEASAAKERPLVAVSRWDGDEYLAAEYFVEEARRKIFSIYGEDELYSGGLSIRTTLDTNMQLIARQAVRDGLNAFDKRHGYRGAMGTLEVSGDWAAALDEFETPRDIAPWRKAVVLSASGNSAKLGLISEDEESGEISSSEGTLALTDMAWARQDLADGPGVGPTLKSVTGAIAKGDVVLVSTKDADKNSYALEQIPNANAGLVAMDPHTGRVLALIGGYSFAQSQFNRATQAYRQPGSAFKPFVYAAALDNGFTPVSQILDAPFVIEHNDRSACLTEEELEAEAELIAQAALDPEAKDLDLTPCFYKPENYSDTFYGLSTMRLGIEKSRNAMTVRLANDLGMRPIIDYGKRFGIYDDVKSELAWALGAGETTVWRLSAAYAALVNGGKAVTPSIIDRVQDKTGKTIFRADERVCPECLMDDYDGSAPPELPDLREQIVNPVTAYQMVSMLEGTVERGTGAGLRRLSRPLAGKTGTTNNEVDAWFMGFSPDMVVGVYVGYDNPAPMKETGAGAALPIFRSFMAEALADQAKVPFRIPEGVLLAPVDATSGEPSFIGAPNTILEAFRPGTEPRLGQIDNTIRVGSGSRFGGSGFGSSGFGENGFNLGGNGGSFIDFDAELSQQDGNVLEEDIDGQDGVEDGDAAEDEDAGEAQSERVDIEQLLSDVERNLNRNLERNPDGGEGPEGQAANNNAPPNMGSNLQLPMGEPVSLEQSPADIIEQAEEDILEDGLY